ncbi:MAG: carbohydrate-binding family 6 protein [Saprospiraceae bacterium]|nr:carbohydrate-binding family 6 protein [Saprospiraceae bacterium]
MELLLIIVLATLLSCASKRSEIGIYIDDAGPEVEFAKAEIRKVLLGKDLQLVDADANNANLIVQHSRTEDLKTEGFAIRREGKRIILEALDDAGIMYGLLEIGEQVAISKWEDIQEIKQNPYMEMRGTKFNIPLDARSPSYTDASDVAQVNMKEMWNYDFWTAYIDQLARYRYNFISCWSLHPFASLVKVPEYPDIALDDVHRSTVDWDEYYALQATGLDAPEIVDQYEIIQEIGIDEKIEFWKKVMAYGKRRNVDFYFVTWNIFVNGTDGKYGITIDADNEVTRDYFRRSIYQLFDTYPDLAGIGLTTGENMHGISFEQKEDWAFDTYGRAMVEVAQDMPDRNFTFIHRQHQADPKYIAEKFAPLSEQENIEFIYSFKYAKAHVFSATRQPYHEDFVKNIGSLKTIWTLRNDDAYYFRWGAPSFVREFIQNIPHAVSRGMYYGSDQWIWGREFTTKEAQEPRQLEIVKHWYHWLMWGRLSYDPQITDERFQQILQVKFPHTDASTLYQAWHEASMIYPVTTGFHWGRVDFMWYIEGCRSRPKIAGNESGFHDVNTFIDFPVHDKAGNQSIPDLVEMKATGGTTELSTPLNVAQALHQHADNALTHLANIPGTEDQELKATLHDIKTIAHMGKYYAHKIAGSTYVALYRKSRDQTDQEKAVVELTMALEAWKQYVGLAMEQNINPIWTNRVGIVDWQKTTQLVEEDIALAKME